MSHLRDLAIPKADGALVTLLIGASVPKIFVRQLSAKVAVVSQYQLKPLWNGIC